MATKRLPNRQERRWYLHHKAHEGNNRKNTNGRYHQVVPMRDENGVLTGRTKLIRHNAAHAQS